MKKLSIIVVLLMFSTSILFAQGRRGPQANMVKRMKAEKIAFLATELELTPKEAQEFWPVYNEMSEKLKTEKKSRRKIVKDLKENYEGHSDDDCKTKANAIMDSEIKEAQLKKEYHGKIAGIIGYKKASKLLSLEQRFKRGLLDRVNDTQKKPGNGKPNGPKPN